MTRKGLTLIELLVAAGIFVLMLTIALGFLKFTIKDWKKKVGLCQEEQLKLILASRIVREIRSANSILSGSDHNKIILETGLDWLEYSFISDKIRRKKANYVAYLTDKNEIAALTFVYQNSKEVVVSLPGTSFEVGLRN